MQSFKAGLLLNVCGSCINGQIRIAILLDEILCVVKTMSLSDAILSPPHQTQRSAQQLGLSQPQIDLFFPVRLAKKVLLIANGIAPTRAAEVAMCSPITDDRDLQRSIREIVTTVI